MRIAILCLLNLVLLAAVAQDVPKFSPKVNRVLFLLDASGSMMTKWNDETRFETAKKLLVNLIDSVERKNPNVEFAVRAFGQQYSREQKNCTDSKLLVGFSKNNIGKIKQALNNIVPQGMTPIAYSVEQCVNDFPVDVVALNSIVLITDGEENCEGNPCLAAQLLADKRIALKPFIVGLNLSKEIAAKFDCLGTVFTPEDEASFSNTIGIIIKQTLNTTTTQVNLIDHRGNATISDIPFTLLDHNSDKILYNFVHKLDAQGRPDTLFLDPVGVYDIIVHSTPAVRKNGIELTVGKHNIIAVDVPLGANVFRGAVASDVSFVVRKDNELILQQNIDENKRLLVGKYNAEATTLPTTFFDEVYVSGNTQTENKITAYATLSLNCVEPFKVSIIEDKQGKKRMVQHFEMKTNQQVKLQAGNYILIYKASKSTKTESTQSQKIILEAGKYQSVMLK